MVRSEQRAVVGEARHLQIVVLERHPQRRPKARRLPLVIAFGANRKTAAEHATKFVLRVWCRKNYGDELTSPSVPRTATNGPGNPDTSPHGPAAAAAPEMLGRVVGADADRMTPKRAVGNVAAVIIGIDPHKDYRRRSGTTAGSPRCPVTDQGECDAGRSAATVGRGVARTAGPTGTMREHVCGQKLMRSSLGGRCAVRLGNGSGRRPGRPGAGHDG